MTKNNLSRKLVKDFATRCGWSQEGNGNFFKTSKGELVNITLCDSGVNESRQFRMDCDYLITIRSDSNQVQMFHRDQLDIKGVSRIGPDGTKYYQANAR